MRFYGSDRFEIILVQEINESHNAVLATSSGRIVAK